MSSVFSTPPPPDGPGMDAPASASPASSPFSAAAAAAPASRAAVPEHSVGFMRAMSGGEAFVEGDYLFLAADDWLMGIGYPLLPPASGAAGEGREPGGAPWPLFPAGEDAGKNAAAFDAALQRAVAARGPRACFAVAPLLPERLQAHVDNRDEIFVLDAAAPVPAPLRRHVRQAADLLTVTEDRLFTPGHRRLWAEFMGRADLRPNVRELYARTEAVLAASRASADAAGNGPPALDLRLLSALDADGNVTAALLLDYSPERFCAYIIGAHSRLHYSPHATDLLFASLLERCRAEGKAYIHLGLGVNEGIARFKRKWGGLAVGAYEMAGWNEGGAARASENEIAEAVRGFLAAPADMSKAQIFETLPQQREFAMLYEVRKGHSLSYLGGSAHFFRYSFEFSFRRLFEPLHTVIFEGPLDEDFLARVEAVGRSPEPGSPRVIDAMNEADLVRLERTVYGPEGTLARIAGEQRPRRVDVRRLLAETRPWFGFFTLWVAWLERLGWRQSVDLEGWNTARDMGKTVIAMENLEEQVASLESVPIGRVVDFFRRCEEWPGFIRRNVRTYLAGDLLGMMGSSIEFPSRTERVINFRDERFRRRMRPFLEAGNCAVFVGTAHLMGLIPMLREDGFSVVRALPTLSLKLRARLNGLLGREEY